MGLQAHRRRKTLGASPWVFPALALGLALWWWHAPPTIALLQPDSGSYLDGASIRGLVYPALLRVLGVDAIAPFQLALYFAAAGLAAAALARTFESRLAGLAYLLFAGANPELVKYCFTVLTEAPSLACAMFFVAAAARAAEVRAAGFVAMGVLAALAIDLRPVNWSWAPLIPLAAILARAGWRAAFAGLVSFAIPLTALGLLAPPSAAADRRDFLALNLFGKFALLVEAPRDAFEEAAARETKDMRARLAAIGEFGAAFGVRAAYAEHLRYGVWREFAARERDAGLDRVIGLATDRPGAYAVEILRQLRGFWTMPDLIDADERAARAAALAALPDSPLRALETLPAARPAPVVWATRALLAVAFVLSLATMAASPVAGAAWTLAGLAAFALWGNWTLVAALHSALPRYAFGAWPFLGVCLAAAIAAASRIWRSRRPRGTRP